MRAQMWEAVVEADKGGELEERTGEAAMARYDDARMLQELERMAATQAEEAERRAEEQAHKQARAEAGQAKAQERAAAAQAVGKTARPTPPKGRAARRRYRRRRHGPSFPKRWGWRHDLSHGDEMVAQIKALQMTPAEAVARWARAQQLGVVERHRARVATWELIARRGWVHDAQEWLGMLNTSRDVLATFDGDMQRALGEAEAMEAGEGDAVEGRGEVTVATGPGSAEEATTGRVAVNGANRRVRRRVGAEDEEDEGRELRWCNGCARWGHVAADCTRQRRCAGCGSTAHMRGECHWSTHTCTECGRAGHAETMCGQQRDGRRTRRAPTAQRPRGELGRRPEGREGKAVAAVATAVTAVGPPVAAAAARTSSPMKRALEDQETGRRGAGEGAAATAVAPKRKKRAKRRKNKKSGAAKRAAKNATGEGEERGGS